MQLYPVQVNVSPDRFRQSRKKANVAIAVTPPPTRKPAPYPARRTNGPMTAALIIIYEFDAEASASRRETMPLANSARRL